MPRLAGKQGAVYLNASGTNKIADIFNISLEIEQELVECGIKLEPFQKYQQGAVMGRLTGERYITDTATVAVPSINAPMVGGSALAELLALSSPIAANHYVGLLVVWTMMTIATGASGAGTGFNVSGAGWLERVTDQNPRGAASEVWEIRVTDVLPTWTN